MRHWKELDDESHHELLLTHIHHISRVDVEWATPDCEEMMAEQI